MSENVRLQQQQPDTIIYSGNSETKGATEGDRDRERER